MKKINKKFIYTFSLISICFCICFSYTAIIEQPAYAFSGSVFKQFFKKAFGKGAKKSADDFIPHRFPRHVDDDALNDAIHKELFKKFSEKEGDEPLKDSASKNIFKEAAEKESNDPIKNATSKETFKELAKKEFNDFELDNTIIKKKIELTHGIYAVLPRNNREFEIIFNSTPTKTCFERIQSANKKISKSNIKITYSNIKDTTDCFENFLKDTKLQIISIIGHNDNKNFYFMNNTYMSIKRMADLCLEFSKHCIFLSCRANEEYIEGLTRKEIIASKIDLTFSDALNIASEINSFVYQNTEKKYIYDTALLKNLESIMDSHYSSSIFKSNIEPIIVTASGGTLIAGATVTLCFAFDPK